MVTNTKTLLGKSCYYCGNPASSWEDVPPIAMFKGFSCDKIKVPSCKAHNHDKDDNAVLNSMRQTLSAVMGRGQSLHPDVEKAIEHGKSSISTTKRRVMEKSFFLPEAGTVQKAYRIPFTTPQVRMVSWTKMLCCGLIYSTSDEFDPNIDWEAAHCWSPHFYPASSIDSMTLADMANRTRENRSTVVKANGLAWYAGWSSTPKPYPQAIFRFHIHAQPNSARILFRFTFFDTFQWFVDVDLPQNVWSKVILKAAAPLEGETPFRSHSR